MSELIKSEEYKSWLTRLKQRFRQAQIKAATRVNTALLEFYWDMGADIVKKQKSTRWGDGFMTQLSQDLKEEFPEVKGFSKRNLERIRQWFLFYNGVSENATQAVSRSEKTSEIQKGNQHISQSEDFHLHPDAKQLVTQIPWGHNLVIVNKIRKVDEALFYVAKTIENGWSRAVLTHQIESGLYQRQGKAVTNFRKTLPQPQSDLAQQLIKDPYTFDFLTLTENFTEKELEKSLLDHISRFLLELGTGFAFVGKQKELTVGKRDFYIDLLFYHTRLHCYVVIELKTGEFEPEHAGKLNFYIKAVDEQLKTGNDNPTIGILLCKTRDKIVAEYALSDIHKPMGVSEYRLMRTLPKRLQGSLPSIDQIEEGLKNIEEK